MSYEPLDPRIPSDFPPWHTWPDLYPGAGRIVPHEPLTKYLSGGYHPVSIGDVFCDGRYQVRHRLGHGGHSIVWLAKDLHPRRHRHGKNQGTSHQEVLGDRRVGGESTAVATEESVENRGAAAAGGDQDFEETKWVALKIKTAETSTLDPDEDPEIKMLNLLQRSPGDRSESAKVKGGEQTHFHSQLIDHFTITGPNGIHRCLVLEFLGPCVWRVLEACALYEDFFRPDTILRAARQLLMAVDMAHEAGLAHGGQYYGPFSPLGEEDAYKYFDGRDLYGRG